VAVFGKTFGEYVRFAVGMLALIVVVAVLRFGLFQAGASVAQVKWLSVTAVMFFGVFYFGVTVHTRRFGSYRELFVLLFLQQWVAQSLVIVAILLAAFTGETNIYSRPEFGGGGASPWLHVAGHIVFGVVIATLVFWAVGSIVLWITKRITAPRTPALPVSTPPSESASAVE
jgi:hypothetical protein